MHNFLWVFPGTPMWETHKTYGLECDINSHGLAITTKYAYDITLLRPRAKCSLEQDARLMRLLTADILFGCDTFTPAQGRTAAAIIEADNFSGRTAAWLADILDIGGIVIQVYPLKKSPEQLFRLYEDRTVFAELLVPARHYVQALVRKSRKFDERWLLACSGIDLYCTHKPSLVSLTASKRAKPLLDWANGQPVVCDLCELAEYMNEPQELNRLLDQLSERGVETSLRKKPIPSGIKYPGRWLMGTAPCHSLTRLEIDDEENVRCCRHGQVIGSVGDSLEQMALNLSAYFKTSALRRGCHACPNSYCPRCPFPGINDEKYCGMMSRQGRVHDLLNKIRLYSRLPLILEAQRDALGNE